MLAEHISINKSVVFELMQRHGVFESRSDDSLSEKSKELIKKILIMLLVGLGSVLGENVLLHLQVLRLESSFGRGSCARSIAFAYITPFFYFI